MITAKLLLRKDQVLQLVGHHQGRRRLLGNFGIRTDYALHVDQRLTRQSRKGDGWKRNGGVVVKMRASNRHKPLQFNGY